MKSYEEWVATRFVKDRTFSEEIENIIRDGPLRRAEGMADLHDAPDAELARAGAHEDRRGGEG